MIPAPAGAASLDKLRRRAIALLDYIAALARYYDFMCHEAVENPDVRSTLAPYEADLVVLKPVFLGAVLAARQASHGAVVQGLQPRARRVGPRELIVTTADLFDLAVNLDFPRESLPWLLEQLADVGRTVLEVHLVDGPAGRVATRAEGDQQP
jgi:hypothetical protein